MVVSQRRCRTQPVARGILRAGDLPVPRSHRSIAPWLNPLMIEAVVSLNFRLRVVVGYNDCDDARDHGAQTQDR